MSTELKIEKGVAIPEIGYKTGYAATLRKLEVGDSVVLPITINKTAGYVQRVLGMGNYTSRTVEGGVRVWRTK